MIVEYLSSNKYSVEGMERSDIPPKLLEMADAFMNGEVVKYKGRTFNPATNKEDEEDVELVDLWAHEDPLDGEVCKMGYVVGLDAILLTHMVGTYGYVVEVLDTRTRGEIRENLHELI